ncbi:MAG: LLM class flavin-dependent oxidoreductase [Chloroflexi bacterium]|nr:LLM class flavin-dependent oxidoreductase [Chloroflexota bacterium]
MSLPADLQFIFMHSMPYTALPDNHAEYASTWVDFPNTMYDPERGRALWQQYLDEVVLADQLGYDGVMLTEHHSTTHSMNSSCSVTASAVIARTSRIRLYVAGTPINLEFPNRLAEEYAMLDVLSGGRLVCSFPLGTGMEYWANAGQINPATARARFREAVDVLVKAWTEPGPLQHAGEFFNYRYLNVWPRPYQQPHPPIYIVGSGSSETLEFAASRGFGYSVVLLPRPVQLQAFERYRRTAREHGHAVTPDKIMYAIQPYVAETDEKAEAEARPHLEHANYLYTRTTRRYTAPPGYVTLEEFRRRSAAPNLHARVSWPDTVASGRFLCGSPETVACTLERWIEEMGSNRIICSLRFGDLPHWKTVKNLTLFAEEVMPRLRAASVSSHQ